MSYLLKRFFLGYGGLIRWLFFQFLNIVNDKKYPKNISYYTSIENCVKDKNGFTNEQKNFISGIILFVFLLFIL